MKASNQLRFFAYFLLLGLFAGTFTVLAHADRHNGARAPQSNEAHETHNDSNAVLKGYRWRQVGPYRGGRVCAVAGVASQPFTFYLGATGGGVWKTTDGGARWS